MGIIIRYLLLFFIVQIAFAEDYQWDDFPTDRLSFGTFRLSVSSQKDFSFISEGGEYIRISLNAPILGTFILTSAFSRVIGNDALSVICIGFLYLLNPTIEYYLWQKYVPISIGAGYNTDWFLFSPGRELYFKPHIDLNVMFKLGIWFKLTGSFAYLVTDTYDLKHGPRFEFRIGI